jgi:hypothetical protein
VGEESTEISTGFKIEWFMWDVEVIKVLIIKDGKVKGRA